MSRQRDCFATAIMYAVGIPYPQACARIDVIAQKEPRGSKGDISGSQTGVYNYTAHKVMESYGWNWTPTMQIGQGCRVHLRKEELPAGRLIVKVSRHAVAVIDGVIMDHPSVARGGRRCVYGYWREPK
jgi:hypothetical protein